MIVTAFAEQAMEDDAMDVQLIEERVAVLMVLARFGYERIAADLPWRRKP
jgi:hypothetical protein